MLSVLVSMYIPCSCKRWVLNSSMVLFSLPDRSLTHHNKVSSSANNLTKLIPVLLYSYVDHPDGSLRIFQETDTCILDPPGTYFDYCISHFFPGLLPSPLPRTYIPCICTLHTLLVHTLVKSNYRYICTQVCTNALHRPNPYNNNKQNCKLQYRVSK